jgi:predicted permease
MNDLRFACRQLLKKPGFTAVAILTIALSIGANTTVYSWIKATLINLLPGVRDQQRLVVICPRHRSGTVSDTCSYPDVQDFARLTNVFSGVVASQIGLAHLRIDDTFRWTWTQPISANAFEMLGLKPALGRGFLPEEETQPGAHPVAVISYALWQEKFGGRTDVLDKTIEINKHPFVIVGVAPTGFKGTMSGLLMDAWIPLMMHRSIDVGPTNLQRRSDRWAHTLARLQPGVTRAQAQAALDLLSSQAETAFPDTNREIGFKLFPVWQAPYGGQSAFRSLLEALSAMTLVVLLIVIANLSSLQLVRASDRSKEMAVRLALGANRSRILRQLLVESVLLAGLGGLLGVVFAAGSMDWLYRFIPRTYLPLGYDFKLDYPTLVAALGLSVATGILFGLAPAWQATRVNQIEALKDGGRNSSERSRTGLLRSGFVVAEIALALVLLICASLAWQSFQYARRMNVGLDPDHVLVAGLRLESHGYESATGSILIQKLKHRLEETSGVESVAVADWLPLGFEGGSTTGLRVDGYTVSPGEYMNAGISFVSPDYFRTFRIPTLNGREFGVKDTAGSPLVAIVNEEVAKRYFAGHSPIGAKINFAGAERQIVGMVRNGKYRKLNEPQQPFIYLPLSQDFHAHLGVAVRVAGNPYAYVSHLRAALKEVDPSAQFFTELSMIDYMGSAYLVPRIASTLLVALSLIALFLATLGIYGVTAYVVNQRMREFGIRIALGAKLQDIYKLVLQGGIKMAAVGVVIGLTLSLVCTRIVSQVLVGIKATDTFTFLVVSFLLTLVALLACFIPARRASKIDPIVALRQE